MSGETVISHTAPQCILGILCHGISLVQDHQLEARPSHRQCNTRPINARQSVYYGCAESQVCSILILKIRGAGTAGVRWSNDPPEIYLGVKHSILTLPPHIFFGKKYFLVHIQTLLLRLQNRSTSIPKLEVFTKMNPRPFRTKNHSYF